MTRATSTLPRLPLPSDNADANDYPLFDRAATSTIYDQWHGYAKFAKQQLVPRYSFGHGLSYTGFACRVASARVTNHAIEVSVAVTNTGEIAAETPVLAFVTPPGVIERWPYMLKAFARVVLAAGETRVVSMTIERRALHWYDSTNDAWREELGEYGLSFGTDAIDAAKTIFRL